MLLIKEEKYTLEILNLNKHTLEMLNLAYS